MNLRWSLIVLVAAMVIAGHALSRWVTADLLAEVVRNSEINKVKSLGETIKILLAQNTEKTELTAEILSADNDLQDLEQRSTHNITKILDDTYRASGMDMLEVTTADEVVTYSASNPDHVGRSSTTWGVFEALSGTRITVTKTEADGLLIATVAPIRKGDRIVGTITAGYRFNQQRIDLLSKEVNAALALISRQGQLLFSSGNSPQDTDAGALEAAFHEKIPIFRHDQVTKRTTVYLPVLIVDDAFVVLAQIDSAPVYSLLAASEEKLTQTTLLLLLASLLAAALIMRRVLRPLRELRARADNIALEITGKKLPTGHSDEIDSAVLALDTLTERLIMRNRELAESQSAAHSASEVKSQFLSNMSHEIRTPLNGVLVMAELMEDTVLDETQRKYCRAISTSGRALHDLLSDILDISKIEAGKLSVQKVDFDLYELVAEIAENYKEIAEARELALVADLTVANPLPLSGDKVRLRQVLINLLGNALKFTERGRITLNVHPIEGAHDDGRIWLRFSVRDTGIGISAEALVKLFKPFSQAINAEGRNYGGTGLGLIISSRLVQLMGGESIHVDSTVGIGTTMRFDIPFDPASAPLVKIAAATLRERINAHVLVAEDNVVNQEAIRAVLINCGATVTVVNNGQLAVEAMQHGQFDLVLMDRQMPVLDGIAATVAIRAAQPEGRRIPIIALTANAFFEDRAECLAAGMDDYLTKPVMRAVLIATLRRWTPGRTDGSPAEPVVAEIPAPAAHGLSAIDELTAQIGKSATGNIVRIYLGTAATHLAALNHSAELRDLRGLGNALHSLKSSSRLLGAIALAELAEAGEALALSGEASAFDMIGSIKDALEKFCGILSAHPCLEGDAADKIASLATLRA